MSKYLSLSFFLMLLLWVSLQFAKIMWGGELIAPLWVNVVAIVVLVNTVIAMSCALYSILKD